jgi:uncharacterized protein
LGRIIFWVLIGVLFWLFVKGLLKSRMRDEPKPAESVRGEDMVRCARCGVNLPRSEAREEGGKYLCLNNPQCVR